MSRGFVSSLSLRIGLGVLALFVVAGLAGCATAPGTRTTDRSSPGSETGQRAPTTNASPTSTSTPSLASSGTGNPPAARRDGPGPQANYVVEPQPPAGSCHYSSIGADPLPDAHCTPGAVNPQVSPSSLASTICKSGYASSIRPPESITEPEKRASALAYGYTGRFSTAEYDHLVPLELGGDPNDPANLWVEPNENPNATTTANGKDVLEDRLHSLVCAGHVSLEAAQSAIAANWVRAYQEYVGALPTSPAGGSAPPAGSAAPSGNATCTASATPANNGYSGDYDVSVTSDQPNQRATARDSGDSGSDDTDALGSVTILLYHQSPGEQIDVTVGGASCSAVAP
jgi:hypothetical protein